MPRGYGEATRRTLTLDRFKSWLIGWIGYWVIQIIGWTMHWESEGDSYLDEIYKSGRRAIFTFWHGRIFSATYYWRNRGIVVMTSMNRDRKSTRLNSSHTVISYAVFCLKKKKKKSTDTRHISSE